MKKIFLLTESQKAALSKKNISKEYIQKLIEKNKIELKNFSIDDVIEGMLVEFEHGTVNPKTNVTNDSLEKTMKIAIAHLNEKANYYKLLKKHVE